MQEHLSVCRKKQHGRLNNIVSGKTYESRDPVVSGKLFNSVHTQGLQKTCMLSIERSFYSLNTRTVCAIFVYN